MFNSQIQLFMFRLKKTGSYTNAMYVYMFDAEEKLSLVSDDNFKDIYIHADEKPWLFEKLS